MVLGEERTEKKQIHIADKKLLHTSGQHLKMAYVNQLVQSNLGLLKFAHA